MIRAWRQSASPLQRSPSSIKVCVTRQSHHTTSNGAQRARFLCPVQGHFVKSAIWPFSIFIRQSGEMEALETSVAELREEFKEGKRNLEQKKASFEKLGVSREELKELKRDLEQKSVEIKIENSDQEKSKNHTPPSTGKIVSKDSPGAIPYSPDIHLGHVRKVERIFGFKAKNPALVWQALQFKYGSLADTAHFNKELALSGDAALRYAIIKKAKRDPTTKNAVLVNLHSPLSNEYMEKIGDTIGFNKVISIASQIGTMSRVRTATTMEAIFGVIEDQGGIEALIDTLNHIGFGDTMAPRGSSGKKPAGIGRARDKSVNSETSASLSKIFTSRDDVQNQNQGSGKKTSISGPKINQSANPEALKSSNETSLPQDDAQIPILEALASSSKISAAQDGAQIRNLELLSVTPSKNGESLTAESKILQFLKVLDLLSAEVSTKISKFYQFAERTKKSNAITKPSSFQSLRQEWSSYKDFTSLKHTTSVRWENLTIARSSRPKSSDLSSLFILPSGRMNTRHQPQHSPLPSQKEQASQQKKIPKSSTNVTLQPPPSTQAEQHLASVMETVSTNTDPFVVSDHKDTTRSHIDPEIWSEHLLQWRKRLREVRKAEYDSGISLFEAEKTFQILQKSGEQDEVAIASQDKVMLARSDQEIAALKVRIINGYLAELHRYQYKDTPPRSFAEFSIDHTLLAYREPFATLSPLFPLRKSLPLQGAVEVGQRVKFGHRLKAALKNSAQDGIELVSKLCLKHIQYNCVGEHAVRKTAFFKAKTARGKASLKETSMCFYIVLNELLIRAKEWRANPTRLEIIDGASAARSETEVV